MNNKIISTDITAAAIAQRLVAERKRLGLQQEEVRNALDVSYATMSRYENGHRMPEADKIARMAQLGFDVGYVLTGQRPTLCTSDLTGDEQAWVELYRLTSDKTGLSKLAHAYSLLG